MTHDDPFSRGYHCAVNRVQQSAAFCSEQARQHYADSGSAVDDYWRAQGSFLAGYYQHLAAERYKMARELMNLAD